MAICHVYLYQSNVAYVIAHIKTHWQVFAPLEHLFWKMNSFSSFGALYFLRSPFSLKIEVNVPPAHTHYFNPHSVVDRPSPSDSVWCSLALCLSVLLFPPLDGDFYFSIKKRWHGLFFYLTVLLLDSRIRLVRYLVELKENFAKCWLESLLQKKKMFSL